MNRLSRINHENLQIQKNIFNKFIVQKKKKIPSEIHEIHFGTCS